MRFLVLFAVLAAATAASIKSDRRPEIVALCKKDSGVTDADIEAFTASTTLNSYYQGIRCLATEYDLFKETFFTFNEAKNAEVNKKCFTENALAAETPVTKYVKCVADYAKTESVALLANKHKYCVKDSHLTSEMEEQIKKMNFGTAKDTLKYLQCFGEQTKLYHDQAFDLEVMKELYYSEVPKDNVESFKTRCAEIKREIYDQEYDYVHNLFKCMTSDETIKDYFLISRYYN